MTKKIQCFACKGVIDPSSPMKRDSDGKDIFQCQLCGANYKIDMTDYFINRGKTDHIAKTHSSEGSPEIPFSTHLFWIVVGIIAIYLFVS